MVSKMYRAITVNSLFFLKNGLQFFCSQSLNNFHSSFLQDTNVLLVVVTGCSLDRGEEGVIGNEGNLPCSRDCRTDLICLLYPQSNSWLSIKIRVVHLSVTFVVVKILYFSYLCYFKMRTRSLLKFLTLEFCVSARKKRQFCLHTRYIKMMCFRFSWTSTIHINCSD